MSSTGSEPPYEVIRDDADESFFAGNTAIYVNPEAVPYGTGEHASDELDELDAEFAPQPRRRLGKLTVLLAALLVAGGGFLAGVQVQKHQPATPTAGAFAARRGTGTGTGTGFGGGFGGGFAGAGGASGAAGGRTGTGTAGAPTSATGGTSAGSVPAVIGQIVSITGDTVVVKNLGGKMITVKLSSDTTVTQAATAADLKAGQTVIVSGTTGSDGTVTASTVGTR